MKTDDPFYIGWQSRAPATTHRYLRNTVLSLLLLAIVLAIVLATAQRTIGVSSFEWGTVKSFTGILKAEPYPHLLVARPGHSGAQPQFSTYYLVAPFKFGFPREIAAQFNGKPVALKGTLVYRENQTMIEARPNSVRAAENNAYAGAMLPQPVVAGRQTLIGEIVDSKCYLGVMNPGRLTPHRACAIRCISGGAPPVLLVRQKNAPALYFLLVSSDGHQVNKEVLNMVAEPVQITGEIVRQGDLLILRADPKTYRRIAG